MTHQTQDVPTAEQEEICCPLFEPEKWDEVQFTWKEKRFIVDTVPEIFHIPLPGTYAKAIEIMWKKAQDAGAASDRKDFLLLAHDPSAFKGELYMSVTKDVPQAQNVKLSGHFRSKVFEGNYSEIKKFVHQMDQFLDANEITARKHYVHFPYCPKCAKKYGHNYIVILSEVEQA